MDRSAIEEKTPKASPAPTKAISRRQRSKPFSPPEILALGNPILSALISELESLKFPFELVNMEIDGRWVAHLRLSGQMWTEEGSLDPSQEVEPV